MFKRTNDGTVKMHGWYLDSIEDAWNTALEEAAKVIEDSHRFRIGSRNEPSESAKEDAAAIRALKEK